MDLKRMAIVMLICAAACGLIAYESYRFNAIAVGRFLANEQTEEVFTRIQPGVPIRSRIAGFFAIMFAVAGLKLLFSKSSAAK